jgi:hypothetical protein
VGASGGTVAAVGPNWSDVMISSWSMAPWCRVRSRQASESVDKT